MHDKCRKQSFLEFIGKSSSCYHSECIILIVKFTECCLLLNKVATRDDATATILKIDYNQHPIHAPELKNAILSLEKVIGRSFVETLLDALEESGIDLSGSKQYSLRQIKKELASIFGNEVAELLMPRIRKNLAERQAN